MKMSNEITFWEDKSNLKCVKEIYGKSLNDSEWNTFLEIGKASGLNPFLKEIWAVKYGTAAAQIFIGRDGYRIFAVKNKDYDGHTVSSIYSNDTLKVSNGAVTHEYALKNRGDLIGAICTVYKKSTSVPVYVSVNIEEYIQKHGVWADKPETMIKKVAEAQALRMAFPKQFNGTYSEYEMWNENQKGPGMRVVKEETPLSKAYASKADEITASMGGNVDQVAIIHEPEEAITRITKIVDAIHDLGGDDEDICVITQVDCIQDLDEYNDKHIEGLTTLGKRLKSMKLRDGDI